MEKIIITLVIILTFFAILVTATCNTSDLQYRSQIVIILTFFAILVTATCNTSDLQYRSQMCLARNGTIDEEDGHYLEPSLVKCRNDSGVFYLHTRTGLKLVPVIE
jgi:predicted small secreted protein